MDTAMNEIATPKDAETPREDAAPAKVRPAQKAPPAKSPKVDEDSRNAAAPELPAEKEEAKVAETAPAKPAPRKKAAPAEPEPANDIREATQPSLPTSNKSVALNKGLTARERMEKLAEEARKGTAPKEQVQQSKRTQDSGWAVAEEEVSEKEKAEPARGEVIAP
jgi:hypothetical protein